MNYHYFSLKYPPTTVFRMVFGFPIFVSFIPSPSRLAPSLARMGFDRVYPVNYEISFELETENSKAQGCKLLSDIGQCPTKFGKCPSKSKFDRTLVRSKKIYMYCHIIHFCCDKIRLQIHSICILQ